MSNINDETVRAKMRKLRVSTFADVFNEIVNDEAYTDTRTRALLKSPEQNNAASTCAN